MRKVSRKKSLIEKASEKFTALVSDELHSIVQTDTVSTYQNMLLRGLIKKAKKEVKELPKGGDKDE